MKLEVIQESLWNEFDIDDTLLIVQLAALPVSLLMIILNQTNAWYSGNVQPDLIKDIKRKVYVTPILMLFNILFLGVPVVILAIDRWVFVYNSIAVFGVILITMAIKARFCKGVMLSDLSNYLYLLTSLWLTGLIIWATVAVHQNKYEKVSIVENGYFDYIAGVLIACNPLFLVLLVALIGCVCILALGVLALAFLLAFFAVLLAFFVVLLGLSALILALGITLGPIYACGLYVYNGCCKK